MNAGRPHGNAKYHLEKCRCYQCCYAASEYDRNRRRAIAYGRWQPFIDAEPIRQYVHALGEFGIGWMRLARLSGVPRGSMSRLLYGDPTRGTAPSQRVRAKTALAILAVQPTLDNLGARARIDGTGTRRRLQALVAAGWTQSELARRIGVDSANFSRTITSDLLRAATVRAVNALYDELWRINPVEAGVPSHRAAAARQIATSRGWAPIGAWDDEQLDDPDAFPDWTGFCGTPQGRRAHYRARVPVCPPCSQAANQTAAA
ncbi:hypothetical protein [Streptomyces prasinus]